MNGLHLFKGGAPARIYLLPLSRGECFESLIKCRAWHVLSGRRISSRSDQTGKYFLLPLQNLDFMMLFVGDSASPRNAIAISDMLHQGFRIM